MIADLEESHKKEVEQLLMKIVELKCELRDALDDAKSSCEMITELQQKLRDVDNQWNEQCKEIAEQKAENERLKVEQEDTMNAATEIMKLQDKANDKMEKELLATKRSLWLERARRAKATRDKIGIQSPHKLTRFNNAF